MLEIRVRNQAGMKDNLGNIGMANFRREMVELWRHGRKRFEKL
jgi:hypothetical protein